MYSILTTIIVGTFALIDFASGKLLGELRIAIVLEIAAALIFGLTLNALHSRIDHFVDRVLFRRRHAAEKRLRRTARTMVFSQSEQFIDEALVVETMDALDLASVALFRHSGHGYALVRAEGWDPDRLDFLASDDHLVTHLEAELDIVDIREVRWPQKALPMGTTLPR